ncbi:glycoside hydrolase family 5 protein [Alienimonas californiensis]|uniref:Endoglucanase A n=1 Tax=Alienimonas californiensis TaxID=2527989 RepID=A0A517P466_9PLAN|nr:glycoside hydrolase family 5 protein [Alienimonas californiensis]QDT14146.1 Endoglucanase A precursor [Alienimonas californiensis]
MPRPAPPQFAVARPFGAVVRGAAFALGLVLLGAAGALTPTAFAQDAQTPAASLTPNPDFEVDQNGDGKPDGWADAPTGGSWAVEDGNRFLRLTSPKPGETVMLYQELTIPEGVEALKLSWRQRVEGLKVGRQSWFDARIMMEFMDAERKKVSPGPPAPSSRKDTDGWVEREVEFLVPAGARGLKFMPSLFQVQAGTFDLDDLALRPVDPGPLREALDQKTAVRDAKLQADAAKRRAKAAERLAAEDNLISNGDFETADPKAKTGDRPKDWGVPKDGGSWPAEDGNRFLRLTVPEPGAMVMVYRTFDIPADVKALELSWRQRVTGLKKGEAPWHDARILMEYHGVDGKKLGGSPSPAYTQKDTDGWVEVSKSFLVPEEALTLVLMPCLFEANAGTFELDDLVLRPTDPEPLRIAAAQREAERQARFVPPEEPQRENWPSELRVVGNRLHDADGNEVWLQGVNAGGLETLPADRQMIKSVVVAIDDWKANCVRVPMKESFWYGDSAYQKDGGEEYREIIDQIITLAANRGAYIAIDLHRFRAPKPEHAAFWKDFAAKYKDHPAVLFDVFNEPHGISWEVWRNGGWVGLPEGVDEATFLTDEEKLANNAYRSVGMQGLVDAVRSTGAKNVIIASGMFYSNDLSGIVKGYALDDQGGHGIMYAWHTYNWHPGWASVLPVAEKYPIFVGECGADVTKMSFVPAEVQEDPYTWVPDMLGFIQKHRLNWTGWCLHPKASPVMISDWSYTPTPYWGAFAKRALAGEQFEMKKMR